MLGLSPEVLRYDPPAKTYSFFQHHSSRSLLLQRSKLALIFSSEYVIPSYQSAAINTYLTKHKPSYPTCSTTNDQNIGAGGGIYNKAGRGYPDVSAVGDNIAIFNMGAPTLIGGASASAPVFAAILNRINEERSLLTGQLLALLTQLW